MSLLFERLTSGDEAFKFLHFFKFLKASGSQYICAELCSSFLSLSESSWTDGYNPAISYLAIRTPLRAFGAE